MPRPRDSHKLRLLKTPHRNMDDLEAVEDVSVSVAKAAPDPPNWLHKIAKDEWRRVAKDLHVRQWLGVIDENLLAKYCQCFARWREAEDDIDKRGQILKGGDTSKGQDWDKENPSVKSAQRWAGEMEKTGRQFGITPGSRRGWTVATAEKSPEQELMESIQ